MSHGLQRRTQALIYVSLPPADPRTRDLDRPGIAPRPEVLPLADGRDDTRVAEFVARCRARRTPPWVEVGEPDVLANVVAAGGQPWIRGAEAGGPCGRFGFVVLLRAVDAYDVPWVAQGLGRRGMAAALALGAHGVQVDAHTWLLEDSPLHPEQRKKLARRTGRDTQVTDGVRTLGGPCSPRWSTDPQSGLPAPSSVFDIRPGPPLAAWLDQFSKELTLRTESARSTTTLTADPLGTGSCVVQGPMANVSETARFATHVQASGALPFCALGALRPKAATTVLDGFSSTGGRWGAGVIGFDVMPHRDAHLTLMESHPEAVLLLAGASIGLAEKLVQAGRDVWLHTPSPRLAAKALQRGLTSLIFEGREAGGHVGNLTSASLWEEAVITFAATEESSSLLVLAGGIGDSVSAAFAAALSVEATNHGHRLALQVGTAFFSTHEIVEEGWITPSYQQAALAGTDVVVVGQTVGLPLQCSPNTFTQEAIAAEHRWKQEGHPLRERRERVEHHNLGRTRIAAKGIERDGHGGHQTLPIRDQRARGAFTMGQGAVVTSRLTTVRALVESLTTGAQQRLARRPSPTTSWGDPKPVRPRVRRTVRRPDSANEQTPIAIVGMGCVLPGAPDVPSFWRLLTEGRSAIRPINRERWRHDAYFHPDPTHRRTTSYVRMAGVVEDFEFDPLPFRIPPRVVPSMDRAQRFALVAASQAVRGLTLADRSRTGVVLGNSMGGEHSKSLALRIRFREVLAALGRDGDTELEDALDAWFEDRLPPVDVESMSGLLGNVIAGRVASWLDLGGGNMTVDAACAASMGALSMAVDALTDRRMDVVLTGGVDADLSPETFVGFCRTHALSPTGSQPFSDRADGFVMGEGAVVLALQRLDDALAAGHPVHAIVRGVGQSSDGRSKGITAPRVEGQLLAIQRAQARAGVDHVDFVEAHGTGTSLGDQTEVEALTLAYPKGGWLGSVKAQIGHLKGGAGAAGLLKATLALSHGELPPTLHAGNPSQMIQDSPWKLPRSSAPVGRTAGVSAFGFGGTNFHTILEAHEPSPSQGRSARAWTNGQTLVHIVSGSSRVEVARRIREGRRCTPAEALQRDIRVVHFGRSPGLAEWVENGGTGSYVGGAWCGEGPARPPVLVFPGQGSPRTGATDALMQIPASRAVLEALRETDPDVSADPAAQHHLLVATGSAYAALFTDIDVAGVLGHSVGELSALCAGGWMSPADALLLADARGSALHDCPPGAMLAVAGEHRIPDGLSVAARNSPGSTVYSGPAKRINELESSLAEAGVRHVRLDVERAFHSPDVAPAAIALGTVVGSVNWKAGLPWFANVPDVPSRPSPSEIGRALVRAVTDTVDFQGSLTAAHADGHRLFIHMGPGGSLARHIERTLPDSTVIRLHPERDIDGADLVRAAGALLAEGHGELLDQLPGTFCQVLFPTEVPVRPTPDGTHQLQPVVQDHLAAKEPEPLVSEESELVDGSVRDTVVRAISEVTGYPRSAIATDARLDADLGIDSIRKMEILGAVQDGLGRSIDESALARVDDLDLDTLVRLIESDDGPSRHAPAGIGIWKLADENQPTVGAESPDEERFAAMIDSLLATAVGAPVDVEPDPTQLLSYGRIAAGRVLAVERGVPFADHTVSRGPQLPTFENPIPEAPVFFASGGTEGIVAACITSIPGARGVLVGRREQANAPEGFHYLSCDVTSDEEVERAVAYCRSQFGRIDYVVHGAGILRDGPLELATRSDIADVLSVKTKGLRALQAATIQDNLHALVAFSSVSAHVGNPGQALYAAANAMMERMNQGPHRFISIAWSAWKQVGMAKDASLQRLLAARGITAMNVEEATQAFSDALRSEGRLWIAHEPPPHAAEWPTASARPDLRVLHLKPDADALTDHQIGGAPWVPAAVWIREALRDHGHVSTVRILAPTVVRSPLRAHITKTAVQVEDVDVASFSFESAPQSVDVEPTAASEPAAPHYRQQELFHGPSWQVLDRWGVKGDLASADLLHTDLDPVTTAIDAVHQLGALWSLQTRERLVLPTGALHWSSDGTPVRLSIRCRADESGVDLDAVGFDTNGRPCLHGLGVRLTDAGARG